MREVVSEGTATLAQVPGYQIAGKTGTAQAWIKVGGETHRDLNAGSIATARLASMTRHAT